MLPASKLHIARCLRRANLRSTLAPHTVQLGGRSMIVALVGGRLWLQVMLRGAAALLKPYRPFIVSRHLIGRVGSNGCTDAAVASTNGAPQVVQASSSKIW